MFLLVLNDPTLLKAITVSTFLSSHSLSLTSFAWFLHREQEGQEPLQTLLSLAVAHVTNSQSKEDNSRNVVAIKIGFISLFLSLCFYLWK